MFAISIKGLDVARMFQEQNWKDEVEVFMVAATEFSLERLRQVATNTMQTEFQHPSGALAGAFVRPITSYHFPIEGALENPKPYAWRREEGFSGMTDSLGRHYTNDPGIHYMRSSLESQQGWIKRKYVEMMGKAIEQLQLKYLGVI